MSDNKQHGYVIPALAVKAIAGTPNSRNLRTFFTSRNAGRIRGIGFQRFQAVMAENAMRNAHAPMTRARAGESRVPAPIMAEYYAQRSGAGLIIAAAEISDWYAPIGAQGYTSFPAYQA